MPIGCGTIRRLGAALVGQHLDHRVVAACQQARPVGRDLAPELLPADAGGRTCPWRGSARSALVLEHVERLADGRARDAAFGRQLVDGRDLLADRPVARLDAAAEQAGELDVARDDAAIEIDGRSLLRCAAFIRCRFALRDPRLFLVSRYVIKLTYRSIRATGEPTAMTIVRDGDFAAGRRFRALRRGRCGRRRGAPHRTGSLQRRSGRGGDRRQRACDRLLPSLARDSDDYDEVAEGLAAAGFRVLRPKPRGIGRSTGPMTGITLHDLRARHRRGDQEARRRQSRRRRPCLWQLGGADDRGRPSRPGARRGDRRGRRQAISAGAFGRGDQGRQPFAVGRRAPRGAALRILRAGQRSDRLAEGMAPRNPRQPARRGRGGQAGANGGPAARRRCSTCRPRTIRSSRSPSATR